MKVWVSAKFVSVLVCGAMLSLSAVGAEVQQVDFTVRETLPKVTQGKIVKGGLDGCPSPVIRTINGGASQSHGAQVFNGSTDLLEGHAGVQKAFDDFEHEDVTETVKPLGA